MGKAEVKAPRELFTAADVAHYRNLLLMIVVAVPAVVLSVAMARGCSCQPPGANTNFQSTVECTARSSDALTVYACKAASLHPLVLLNIVFFLNVSVLFWLISVLTGSTWLIDPYWTFCPPMMLGFLWTHPQIAPLVVMSHTRVFNTAMLLLLWATRLTHSYFRREDFTCGAREDWRFTDMRNKYGSMWTLVSFPLAYLSQQLMLVGLVAPFYAIVHSSAVPWGALDFACLAGCVAGLTLAYAADTELHDFIEQEAIREASGVPRIRLLNSGVWYLCRHPNYAGEQLFWWAIGGFAASQGWPVLLAGAALNTVVLWNVTKMTEDRMLADTARSHLYVAYQDSTPMWLPLGKIVHKGIDC
eukprot:c45864_g1_i1.p1 GENE.c45864_g1_i1~~c45864_g1_i1.p1  ORF type:complete len:368 (+),score=58.92 c45864_g1_i1:29-1105(+)